MTPEKLYKGLPDSGATPNLARRELVKSMYEEGMTLRQIAKSLGITYQAVHSMLQRTGVTLRPRGGNTGSHSRRKV